MITDPITDMFNRIMNAQAVKKETVDIPFSQIKQDIAAVLKRGGFIKDFDKKGRGAQKHLEVELLYKNDLMSFKGFKRISSPGQRIYKSYKEIFPVRNGYGINIVSTSHGIMSGDEARKKKVGGEMLAKVW